MGSLLFLAIILPACFGLFLTLPIPGIRKYAGILSSLATLGSFIVILLIFRDLSTGESAVLTVPWAPSLKVNLSFLVDGLSLFFGFLVTGVGTLVNFYAHYYMYQDDKYLKRFYIHLNLFTTAMLGCVFSNNLILLFVFWELTGVTSFLLVGHHFDLKSTLMRARMVFLVTSLTSLALLVGVLIIGIAYDTFLWTEVVSLGAAHGSDQLWYTVIVVCFMIAIFGKSAQIPFHFWLPNAMCAPTPVSAYLHSATMVKLGIFLTARMYPLFVLSDVWFPLVVSVCLTTMLVGAVLSLLSNDLKMILAYATVSQLGFFISIYGMGDVSGVVYDFVHIFNHAFYKGSLFMLVGIIDHATGARDIRQLGGLWRYLPETMVIFFIATLTMAGVPGTTGFISKELILKDLFLFETDVRWGLIISSLILIASVFKVAFSIRLFYHLFIREQPIEKIAVKRPHWKTLIAPGILSMCALFFGIWPMALEKIVENFYVAGIHSQGVPTLKVWHGWSIELLVSVTILVLGVLLFFVAEKRQVWSQKHPFPDFGKIWNNLMTSCVDLAEKCTLFLQGPSIHRHLAILLLSFAFGVGGILITEGNFSWLSAFAFPLSVDRLIALVMIAGISIAIPFLSGKMSQVLALASSGFFVTLYFVFYKAPDLAMTQILIEVVTGMMLLVMVWVFRKEMSPVDKKRHSFLRFLTSLSVALAGVMISLSYSGLEVEKSLSKFFLAHSLPLAQGANVVNVILVDFRGLDTLGEITVLFIAGIAIIGLVSKNRKQLLPREGVITMIPSRILRALTPIIFLVTNIFAIYLLLRGHNLPGGGFIGGLASGISFILLGFILQVKTLEKLLPLNMLLLCGSGALLAVGIGLVPLVVGKAFLTHSFLNLPSALIFDIGVFIVVLGITLISIFSLRSDALKEGKK